MLNHHSSTHPQFSFSAIFVFFTFTNFFYNIFTSIIFFLMEKLIRNICFNFYLFLNKKLFSCSFTYKLYLLDLDLENPNSKKKKKIIYSQINLACTVHWKETPIHVTRDCHWAGQVWHRIQPPGPAQFFPSAIHFSLVSTQCDIYWVF